MNRVTADSNIYISAFLRGGKPRDLLELARAGDIELAVSADSPCRCHLLKRWTRCPTTSTDNRILECAVAGASEVVVTGDGHLLTLVSFRGISIMRVGEFLQRLKDSAL